MNGFVNGIIIMLGLMSMTGCSLLTRPPGQADEVLVRIQADPRLNLFRGQAHALVLHIYQLETMDAFRNLLATNPGPGAILNSGTAPFPALAREALVVQPGQRAEYRIARVERGRFMVFVAGYYRYENVEDYVLAFGLSAPAASGSPLALPVRDRAVIGLRLGPESAGSLH